MSPLLVLNRTWGLAACRTEAAARRRRRRRRTKVLGHRDLLEVVPILKNIRIGPAKSTTAGPSTLVLLVPTSSSLSSCGPSMNRARGRFWRRGIAGRKNEVRVLAARGFPPGRRIRGIGPGLMVKALRASSGPARTPPPWAAWAVRSLPTDGSPPEEKQMGTPARARGTTLR